MRHQLRGSSSTWLHLWTRTTHAGFQRTGVQDLRSSGDATPVHDIQARLGSIDRLVMASTARVRACNKLLRWAKDTGSKTSRRPPMKRALKSRKVTVPLAGIVGAASVLFASGASAATGGPTTGTPLKGTAPSQAITLIEEIADVSLATFRVFDRERLEAPRPVKTAHCRGCGGCRG
jgi:hypothetical protein